MTSTERRNRAFVRNMVEKGMTQTDAYANAQGRKVAKAHDSGNAVRMKRKESVQRLMQEMRQRYIEDSGRAYAEQWALAGKETTPPHVKMNFYDKVQDRGGLGAIDIGYTEHKHKYDDLNMSREELLNILQEPRSNRDSVLAVEQVVEDLEP